MHNKKIISVIIASILSFLYATYPVLAQDITITGRYSGKLTFETDNDYIFKISKAMPGQEWETKLYFKNTSDYTINMKLDSVVDNGSDKALLSNMFLKLYNGDVSLYDGEYPCDTKPVTDVFQIPPQSDVTVTALCGINRFSGNNIRNKSMNTSWVFEGTLIDSTSKGDFTDEDGYVTIVDENGNTYKVKITDIDAVPIINAHVEIKDGNVVVNLPDGKTITQITPIIVHIDDKSNNPVKDMTAVVNDTKGNAASNKTNSDGDAVVPVLSWGSTDNKGNTVIVDENGNVFNVNISDFKGEPIKNAKVEIRNGEMFVIMPDGKVLTREDAIVATVRNKEFIPVENVPVTASDKIGNSFSDRTNSGGKVFLPILRTNITDNEGNTSIIDDNGNLYNIKIVDEKGDTITNAKVTVNENGMSVELPDDKTFDIDNPIYVIVTNKDNVPVPMAPVTVTDKNDKISSAVTDANGTAVIPVAPKGKTNSNGHMRVTDTEGNVYKIDVADESGKPIIGADVEILDNGEVKIDLPEIYKLTPYYPIVVTITDKNDEPREGVKINVKDTDNVETTDTTDVSGIAKIPVSDEAMTDNDGTAVITGSDGTRYIVKATTSKNEPIANVNVQVKSDKIEAFLPDEYTLTTNNQTVITVVNKDFSPIENVSVTVTDKNEKTVSKNTDAKGQVVVPNKSSGSHKRSSNSTSNELSIHYRNTDGTAGDDVFEMTAKVGDNAVSLMGVIKNRIADMTIAWSSDNENVAIVDKNGIIAFVGEGTAVITAQSNGSKNLLDTVKVTVKPMDKVPSATDNPSKSGTSYKRTRKSLISPYMFSPYITGYENGNFYPDSAISREELSTIFARAIANNVFMDKKYESSFTDVQDSWSKSYIGYLEQFKVVTGYEDGSFRPYNKVTRAEMAVMLAKMLGYDVTPDIKASATGFIDVGENYASWSAAKAILILSDLGIMSGYPDNTFHPEQSITRAEVVSTLNRVLTAQKIVSYDTVPSDMTNEHWAYKDILFAMNARQFETDNDTSGWAEWYDNSVLNEKDIQKANWNDYRSGAITNDNNNDAFISDKISEKQITDETSDIITASDSNGNMNVRLYAPNDNHSMIKNIPIVVVISMIAMAAVAATVVAIALNRKKRKRKVEDDDL